jgi:hypothetical protein
VVPGSVAVQELEFDEVRAWTTLVLERQALELGQRLT